MQAVADRLESVPAIAGRVKSAAQFGALLERNQLSQVCPAAFVLPLGLRGMQADAATGMYRQALDRLVGVVLVVRHAGDATGARAVEELQPLIDAVIETLCGWAPDGAVGVLTLSRGELASIANGTVTYQLDFLLTDQLRIAR